MPRVACFLALLLALAGARAEDWPTATPESQGMDSAALAQLVDYGANAGMDSLVVARNGRIVAQAYYGPYREAMPHRMNSATKSVVGMLTGIAIGRGDMPPPATHVSELFPALRASADARWQALTVQHLLEMRSGIAWDEPLDNRPPRSALEMEASRNWEEFILARPMAQAPGTTFDYNSGNPQLLSIALMHRTGMPTEDYARKFLFGPLGIADLRWRKDPQGAAIGGFGLYMRTRDMARLGQLYLQHGEWKGQQLVPRAWADRVFAPQVDMGPPGLRYADFWWSLPAHHTYMMVGFNRQLVLVMPDLNLVAAMTGRQGYPFDDVIGHLRRAAASAQPLPENAQAQALLHARVDAAANGPAPLAGSGARPEVASGRFVLDENRSGVREVSFDFAASPATYRMRLRTHDIAAPLGLDGRFAEGSDAGAPFFTRGAWRDAHTLLVEQRWPEEAAAVSYVIRFDGDTMEIRRSSDNSGTGVIQGHRTAQD